MQTSRQFWLVWLWLQVTFLTGGPSVACRTFAHIWFHTLPLVFTVRPANGWDERKLSALKNTTRPWDIRAKSRGECDFISSHSVSHLCGSCIQCSRLCRYKCLVECTPCSAHTDTCKQLKTKYIYEYVSVLKKLPNWGFISSFQTKTTQSHDYKVQLCDNIKYWSTLWYKISLFHLYWKIYAPCKSFFLQEPKLQEFFHQSQRKINQHCYQNHFFSTFVVSLIYSVMKSRSIRPLYLYMWLHLRCNRKGSGHNWRTQILWAHKRHPGSRESQHRSHGELLTPIWSPWRGQGSNPPHWVDPCGQWEQMFWLWFDPVKSLCFFCQQEKVSWYLLLLVSSSCQEVVCLRRKWNLIWWRENNCLLHWWLSPELLEDMTYKVIEIQALLSTLFKTFHLYIAG